MTRHLVHQHHDSYNIICLDKMENVSFINNILELFQFPSFRFIHGSITDPKTVSFALEAYQPCAELIRRPLHFYRENNVVGTHVLLDAVKNYGNIKRFIHIYTDEVYGETNGTMAKEDSTLLAPTNPYSASKAAAEIYVMAYKHSFGIPVIIVRSNNVYGPCQYPERDGTHARRFLYVGDAADALETILHKGADEIYNIDSRYKVQNRKIAAYILELFGRDPVSEFNQCVRTIFSASNSPCTIAHRH
ncbi:uncharacterized protein ASPGLDRAFT_1511926 [Aspergillus glaucus CBS 516.65]|uniref:NAD(P)-binding domain-containing protein n=1 Tax=Aspergillus glaucus CBS 516.65 TaxID=1160497 RepID=A0A1L9VRY3_ASPGL|nr:hypothetical protein ASPGLDRAFT_1511926 [Aspergillus glaucus CBS 516.65]OJJ86669.1 hypothetical protein ASPGLDRAFT_1511926 [Aspergillus glaucus CBS 516.65]